MIFRAIKQLFTPGLTCYGKRAADRPALTGPMLALFERDDISKTYTRLFATSDGRKVLAHLQSITMARAYGAETSDEQIRYSEGQRALVATIMRLSNMVQPYQPL